MAFLNSSNPTKLRVGTTGRLEGRAYTVVGRVVLSTADGYKWQEYNLREARGEVATLVYESGDWKLFRMFDPADPMPVREAELVRADDTVTINGRSVAVTYVGKSRVVYIEGTAPEGVELNDRASYFNAEPAAGGMIVVSWTGQEMEFYEGHNLRDREVAAGFNLPRPNMLFRAAESFRGMELDFGQVMGFGVFLVIVLMQVLPLLPDRDPVFKEPTPKQVAPAPRLAENATGLIMGHTYTVRARALVEIARPGLRFDRYEYSVVNELGEPALLIQGVDNAAGDWALLTPGTFPPDVTPYSLSGIQVGLATGRKGEKGNVIYLCQSRARDIAGRSQPQRWPADVQYGFWASTDHGWMLVRWTEQQIWCDQGRRYSETEIADAFRSPVSGGK